MIGNKSFHFIFLKLGRFQNWSLPLVPDFQNLNADEKCKLLISYDETDINSIQIFEIA